jgi:hypothetical protein
MCNLRGSGPPPGEAAAGHEPCHRAPPTIRNGHRAPSTTTSEPGRSDRRYFSIASGGVGGAQVADGSLSAVDLGFVRAVNFPASALANGQCASAIQSQTAQFAPGQEGDFTLMSSSPALPLNFVLAGRVGPINGGFRDYYFSVCNLTGSTANMPATTVRMLVIAQ